MENTKQQQKLPEDDWVVYIPDDAMRAFESAYFKMWQARQELQKVADGMKQVREER